MTNYYLGVLYYNKSLQYVFFFSKHASKFWFSVQNFTVSVTIKKKLMLKSSFLNIFLDFSLGISVKFLSLSLSLAIFGLNFLITVFLLKKQLHFFVCMYSSLCICLQIFIHMHLLYMHSFVQNCMEEGWVLSKVRGKSTL